MINQTLNAMGDDDHQRKYYQFLLTKGITIVSDIFERMDMDRKISEALRRLQVMDNLSEEEYYKKRAMLMRKLTKKSTAYLYEKPVKLKLETREEKARKKEHEETLARMRGGRKKDGDNEDSEAEVEDGASTVG